MLAESWNEIGEIFASGLELNPAERDCLLVCCDGAVAEEVRNLWQAHDSAGEFLKVAVIPAARNEEPVELEFAGEREIVKRIGPYRILYEFGRGGMGTVYRAVRDDNQFEQNVAIKLIKRGFDTDDIIGRFRAERQILAGLVHPGIARLLDGGSTLDGRPYLVLEPVDGERIDDWCKRQGLSLRSRIELFLKVCDAVAYAHRQLVIHRDIKPSNLLVTNSGEPKLLDFGIARVLVSTERDVTATEYSACTPEYASPEQRNGGRVSTTTDVFSLATVLYELLTGMRPGSSNDGAGIKDKDLNTVLSKALRTDPEERYSTVEQFAGDLGRYLRTEPIQARPADRRYRVRKFVSRNKPMVAAGLLAAIGLSIATGWAIYQTKIARQERQTAELRFQQTRKLANSLLFQIYDEIKGLKGSTSAREQIVREGLSYLDAVSGATGKDLQLRYEIAVGYRRLAQVQGDPFNSSKGDRAAALASIQKAIKLQESIVAISPFLPSQVFLSVLYDDESRYLADPNAARAASGRSLAITRRYAAQAPTHENLEFLAIGLLHDAAYYQSKETLATWTSELAESIEIFHKLAASGVTTIAFQTQHAFAHKRMGSLLWGIRKDSAGAAAHYQEALGIDQALVKQHPERADLRYDLTFTENDLAGIEMDTEKFDTALNHIQDVLAIRKEMQDADPNDTRARDGVASADQTMSDLLARQKHYPAAFDYARRSVELMGGANQTPTVRLARGLIRMGLASVGWAKSGQAAAAEHLAAASSYYKRALAMYNELNSRTPLAMQDAAYVKFIQSALAEIETLRSK
jgi:hypothetical protein